MTGSRTRVMLVLALALALMAVAAWCGLSRIDDRFARTHHSLDLDHPERWASDPIAVAPGTLGRLLWRGERPLEAHFGPVAAGDLLKLKLRAERPGVQVRLLLDGREVVTGPAPVDWVQVELLLPWGGQTLRLEQPGRPPSPIHVSRVSATNVRGFVEGPITLYLPSAAAGGSREGAAPWPVALVVPVLLAALAAWRRRDEPGGLARSVGMAVLEVLPGVALLGLAEVVLLATGGRLVYPTRTYLLLVAGPPLVIEAIRQRRRVGRALAALGRGCVALVDRAFARAEATAARLGLDRVTASAAEAEAGIDCRDLRRAVVTYLVVVALLAVLFANLVIGDWGGPMLGEGDLNLWIYQGYYLIRNLTLTPLPHLDLVNYQLWYPYGGSNVFQPWVLDMHLFSGAADRLLGLGPWLQLYYLLTVVGTAIGAFVLLVRDHGALRAGVAGVAVSFCSYYAIAKYAGHLGVACTTWMTLNLLADWLVVRRVVLGRPLSARLLAVRALLLALVLGQDLSYIAGVALTSFMLSAFLVAAVTCVRSRFRPRRLLDVAHRGLAHLRVSAGGHPVQVAGLVGAAILVAFLWVPLVLQINDATRAFDLSRMPKGGSWANPLRLLMPVMPGFNPVTHRQLFDDSPEGWFAASPGLFFLLSGLLGVVWGWRRVLCWLPFLALLAFLLSFHPDHFPLLRVLPWFSFARVCGRFSVAYPAILTILGLSIPATAFRRRLGLLVAVLGCGFLAVEAVTAYQVALVRPRAFYRPDAAFIGAMETIREAPGEAVLEWPFCIAGGNGVATGELGLFYRQQAGTSVQQLFHHKMIVGKYFGRLHPDQILAHREAGWPRMFFPDRPDPHKATRQRRDFRHGEWRFLERFFVLNDFCGVLLYADLLPPTTVEGFHRRFGQPAAVVDATPFGRLEFIPKRTEWRGLVDREAGRRLTLPYVAPPRPVKRLRLSDPAAAEFLIQGWGPSEKKGRSTRGHLAEIGFTLERIEPLELEMQATTFQRQRIRIQLNGLLVDETVLDGRDFTRITLSLPVELLRLENVIRFELPDAHSPKSVGVNQDTRVLGLTLDWLELQAVE